MNLNELFGLLQQIGRPAQPVASPVAQAGQPVPAQPVPAPGFWQQLQGLVPAAQDRAGAFVDGLKAFATPTNPGVAPGAIYDPSKQVSGGQQVVGGVRAGQIERAINGEAVPGMDTMPKGFPEAGGQGFFKPSGGRQSLTPGEAEMLRQKIRQGQTR
jgi:hypothetical protein